MFVSADEMLKKAVAGHYAVGQFNINNLEWTKEILLAAEEAKSPVILGVSEGAGKYMTGFKTVAAMAGAMIEELGITEPENLEEQALSLVGRSVYEKLVKGYTEKQWGRDCKELPAFIIKRLPLRFIYDNNYFNDRFQGIPMGGYTAIVEKMLEGSDVLLNTDYYEFRKENPDIAAKTVYTGMLDQYFDYKYGVLEYRSVRFETEKLDMENYQGNAVVNYTEREVPYTRIIEHKHFEYGTQPVTVISREYPSEWKLGEEPYYPVNNTKNEEVAEKYRALAAAEKDVIFGGRLGEYRYYDMDKVIEAALRAAEREDATN